MALPQRKPQERYTYAAYLGWPDSVRGEIIHGEFYDMSPAPGIAHQAVSMEIGRQLGNFLAGERCRVFAAPVDVVLPAKGVAAENSDTVVQPDIVVVCDPRKITERCIVGAPNWIIEIASPATAKKDSVTKRALYEAHGVAEYWQLFHKEKLVWIFRLGKNDRYGDPDVLEAVGTTKSSALAGFKMNWKRVFPALTK